MQYLDASWVPLSAILVSPLEAESKAFCQRLPVLNAWQSSNPPWNASIGKAVSLHFLNPLNISLGLPRGFQLLIRMFFFSLPFPGNSYSIIPHSLVAHSVEEANTLINRERREKKMAQTDRRLLSNGPSAGRKCCTAVVIDSFTLLSPTSSTDKLFSINLRYLWLFSSSRQVATHNRQHACPPRFWLPH